MLQLKDGFRGERAVVIPPQVLVQMDQDKFCEHLYVTDIGYYPSARHHFRRRDNGALQYIFIWCIAGRGWVECDGERHDVEPNQYFIIPAGVPHAYGADDAEPWTIYWLHFKGGLAGGHFEAQNCPTIFAAGDPARIAAQINLFDEMLNTLQTAYTLENMHYVSACLGHFLGILKFTALKPTVTHHQHSVIERTVAYLQQNIDMPITSDEIAEHLGYSYSHLSTLFTRRFGCSPCNYLLRLKMQKACHFLDFTDMKINEISYRIGIEDPYYFSRVFRKVIGIPPRHYRKQIKG